jgi:hypothetical protein
MATMQIQTSQQTNHGTVFRRRSSKCRIHPQQRACNAEAGTAFAARHVHAVCGGSSSEQQQQRTTRHQRKQQYPHPYRHQFGFMKYLIRIYLLSQPVNFFSQNAADIRL